MLQGDKVKVDLILNAKKTIKSTVNILRVSASFPTALKRKVKIGPLFAGFKDHSKEISQKAVLVRNIFWSMRT